MSRLSMVQPLTTRHATEPLISHVFANVSTTLNGYAHALPREPQSTISMICETRARKRTPLASDERITVDHCQPFPLHQLCLYHFHNGRTIAGFRRGSLTPLMRVLRSGSSAILPGYLVGLRVGQMWQERRHRARLIASLPWMLCLVCAQAAGEAIGHLAGSYHHGRLDERDLA